MHLILGLIFALSCFYFEEMAFVK